MSLEQKGTKVNSNIAKTDAYSSFNGHLRVLETRCEYSIDISSHTQQQ